MVKSYTQPSTGPLTANQAHQPLSLPPADNPQEVRTDSGNIQGNKDTPCNLGSFPEDDSLPDLTKIGEVTNVSAPTAGERSGSLPTSIREDQQKEQIDSSKGKGKNKDHGKGQFSSKKEKNRSVNNGAHSTPQSVPTHIHLKPTGSPMESSSTVSSLSFSSGLSGDSSSAAGRFAKMNDKSLSPGGCFAIRCNTALSHLPAVATGNRPKCALHRWAAGVQRQRDVVLCKTCNVNLCLDCYTPFHTNVDLIASKKKLSKHYKREASSK